MSFKKLILKDVKVNEFSKETKAWLEDNKKAFDAAGTQNPEYADDYESQEDCEEEAFDAAGTQNGEYASGYESQED